MEMPITVIITLFVAIVVAGILIAFSQNLIFQGKEQLRTINKKENDFDEKLIELPKVDGSNIIDLAIQCAKDVPHAVEETLCFVVKSDSFDLGSINPIDGQVINPDERTLTLRLNIDAGFNALFIKYNPLGYIEINS